MNSSYEPAESRNREDRGGVLRSVLYRSVGYDTSSLAASASDIEHDASYSIDFHTALELLGIQRFNQIVSHSKTCMCTCLASAEERSIQHPENRGQNCVRASLPVGR
jgi:hypothetical protein